MGNLNLSKKPDVSITEPEDPLYPADDIYGIVGDNVKKTYDIREVRSISIPTQILVTFFQDFFKIILGFNIFVVVKLLNESI